MTGEGECGLREGRKRLGQELPLLLPGQAGVRPGQARAWRSRARAQGKWDEKGVGGDRHRREGRRRGNWWGEG